MNRQDRKTKIIHAENIKKNCEIRAEYSAKDKPTEKVEKYFRRKAYERN